MTTVAPQTSREAKPRRSKAKPPLHNRRTRLGRRVAELERTFTDALGGSLTPVQAEQVKEAAQLSALAEQARADCSNGKAVLDDAVRAARVAALAVKRLGIKPAEKHGQSRLAQILAGAE